MCRFLMIRSKKAFEPKELLDDFSLMCKNNSEWQGDGWGIAYKVQKSKFKVQRSLEPIWENIGEFDEIPPSDTFIVHARGASFPNQKGDIGYNQPYIGDNLCYVFNGELYGVRINVEGKIGAQKIFSLVKKYLDKNDPKESLAKIQNLLIKNSKGILGLNIGFVLADVFFVSCYFGDDTKKDYYTVRYFKDEILSIICSEKISNYPWRSMKKGEILQL